MPIVCGHARFCSTPCILHCLEVNIIDHHIPHSSLVFPAFYFVFHGEHIHTGFYFAFYHSYIFSYTIAQLNHLPPAGILTVPALEHRTFNEALAPKPLSVLFTIPLEKIDHCDHKYIIIISTFFGYSGCSFFGAIRSFVGCHFYLSSKEYQKYQTRLSFAACSCLLYCPSQNCTSLSHLLLMTTNT